MEVGPAKKIWKNIKITKNQIAEDMRTYVTKFQWEAAKYPVKQSLKTLSELIGKVGIEMTKIILSFKYFEISA